MLVFVPLTPEELRRWALDGTPMAAAGFAATPAFLEAFGLIGGEDEDAELTLACVASLDGLLRHGVRLLAVVDAASPTPAEPADFGAVRLAPTRYARVTALFADGPGVARRVAELSQELGGATLATAWEDPRVEALLREENLLWHGSAEWRLLPH